MSEDKTTFEQTLRDKGVLVYNFHGVSMQPLLRQERDMVVIRPAEGRLKKYDVALYRYPSGKYVLHRVVRVLPQSYVIRGDNCWKNETNITDAQILGVLIAYIRGGKQCSMQALHRRLYARFWVWTYPLRKTVRFIWLFLTEGIPAHFKLKKTRR